MKNIKGYLFIISAAYLFGFTPIIAKFSYSYGNNALSLLIIKSFCCLPILFLLMQKKGIALKISKKELKHIIILGSLGSGLTTLLLFQSYRFISVGSATTIHYIYPVLVTIATSLFFKEKLRPVTIVCLITAMLGIFLLTDGNLETNFYGISLAMSSGLSCAFYMLYLDHSSLENIYPLKLTFYVNLFAGIVLFLFALFTDSLIFTAEPTGWLLSLAFTILYGCLGVTLFQSGILSVGSATASILSTFEPLTSVVFGIFFLNETFSYKTIIGCSAVLLSTIILALSKIKKTGTP